MCMMCNDAEKTVTQKCDVSFFFRNEIGSEIRGGSSRGKVEFCDTVTAALHIIRRRHDARPSIIPYTLRFALATNCGKRGKNERICSVWKIAQISH